MTESRLCSVTSRAGDILTEAVELARRQGTEKLSVMAVTKNQPVEMIEAVRLAGFRLFGENRVQQYLQKKEYFDAALVKTHLIGHLQSNKVNHAVGNFHMIQSVDSVRIAGRIGRAAREKGITQDVLIEVNAGQDPNKFGFLKEQLDEAADEIRGIDGVRVRGLMTVPPMGDLRETAAVFQVMQKLFVDMKRKKSDNDSIDILSMGMSGDYKIAVREGSNMIRLGTVLFC